MAIKPCQQFPSKYPSLVHTTFQEVYFKSASNTALFLPLCVQALQGQYVDEMNGIMWGITGRGSKHFLKAAKKGACFKTWIKLGEKYHERDPWGLVGTGRENWTTVSNPYSLVKLIFVWISLGSCSCSKEEVQWPSRAVLKPQESSINQFSRKQLLLPTILFEGWGKIRLYCPGFPLVLHPAIQLMITTDASHICLHNFKQEKNRLLFSFHWPNWKLEFGNLFKSLEFVNCKNITTVSDWNGHIRTALQPAAFENILKELSKRFPKVSL